MRVPTLSALLWLLAPISPATAVTPEPFSEDLFLDTLPVVLSATRLKQPLADSPMATTIIDRQMIEASGATEIQELMRLAPGVLVGYQTGHRPAVSYHMLEEQFSRRMQVLVDGRSVYTPAFGSVHWPDLPLAIEDVERIEVIRGPNVAAHGANAFLGTINIVTRDAALDRGTMLSGAAGNNRLRRAVARHGAAGGKLDYRVTVGYQADAGLENRHDGRHTRMVSGRADYRAGLYDTLTVQAGYSTGERDEDTDFDGIAADIYPPHEASSRSHYQQLRWARSPTPEREWVVQLYHDYQIEENALLSNPIDELGGDRLDIDYGIEAERFDLELQHTAPAGEGARLVWGAGARLDRVASAHWFATDETLDNWQYRLFANLEQRLGPRLLTNLGAMIEDTDLSDPEISPRAALNYTPAPGNTFRLAISRAKRFPFLLEQKADERYYFTETLYEQQMYSAGGLEPESIDSIELGYLRQASDRITVDVKLYRDEIENLISYTTFRHADLPFYLQPDDFDQELKLMDNYDRARIKGAELSLDFHATAQTRLWLAYAYTDIQATQNTNQVKYTRTAPFNQVSLLAMHDFSDTVAGSLGLYYLDEMQAWESVLRRGDSQRLDLRLAKRFRIGRARAEVAAVAQHVSGDQRGIKLANGLDDRAYIAARLEF